MAKQIPKRAIILKWVWRLGFSIFFYLMLAITLRYFPINPNVAFLQIKQSEITSVPSYFYIFYIHVCSSAFTLLAGFTQFSTFLLKRYPIIHKTIGMIYVYTVVLLSGPSGIYIGYYANGGITSKISFILLGILWLLFTILGIRLIKTGNRIGHEKFMLRSFALAFSAITLRLWKVVLVFFFHPPPMEVYRIIAWLGWIPNLLLIEWYIIKKYKK